MTRMEYLEELKQDLEVKVSQCATALKSLTSDLDKQHYKRSRRDTLVKLAVELYDHKADLKEVKDELEVLSAALSVSA